MNILGIGKLFDSILGKADSLIDNVTTTKEEKLEKKNELQKIINEAKSEAINFELKREENRLKEQEIRANTVNKEIEGTGIQKNWRPIVALGLFFILFCNMFLFPIVNAFLQNPSFAKVIQENTNNSNFWTLLNIMIGGYTFTRGGEKIVKTIASGGKLTDVFKKNTENKE